LIFLSKKVIIEMSKERMTITKKKPVIVEALIRRINKRRFEDNVEEFGYLPLCTTCKRLGKNCQGQYNAPGLSYFYCGDYQRKRK